MEVIANQVIPPAWGGEPPNHRGFDDTKPYDTVGIFNKFYSFYRRHWKLLVVVTVIGHLISTAVGTLIFLLLIGAYVGAWVEAQRRLHVTAAWQKKAQGEYNRQVYEEWAEWIRTRPLNAFAHSPRPRFDAASYVSRHGTIYIGVDTTVHQDLVVGGRRQSALVVAPAGSGKTLGIAVPAVSLHPGPAVFASTKLDGMRYTALPRASSGRLWLYDPLHAVSDNQLQAISREHGGGVRIFRAYWTPLTSVFDWDSAKITAKSLIAANRYGTKNDASSRHWDLTAEELLAPMLFAASFHPDGSMNLLRDWIRSENVDEPLEVLQAAHARLDGRAQMGTTLAISAITSRMLDRNVKHESDVWSTLKTMIQAYEFTGPMMDAGRQNFDPDTFVRSRDTLYMAGDAQMQEFAAPLFVSLIDALYQATTRYDRASPFETHSRGPLLCALDEARNIAPTPYLFRYLSEGLGQGFQTMVFLQSLSQAEAVWGREGRSITDFANIKVLFGGISDPATLEAFSVLSGDYDREYITYSTNASETKSHGTSEQISRTYGAGWPSNSRSEGSNYGESFTAGTSETKNVHKERHLTPGDLASLNAGEALVVIGSKWQIVRVGGDLIGKWLQILTSNTELYPTSPPRELPRRVPALPAAAPPVTPPYQQSAILLPPPQRQLRMVADDDDAVSAG